MNYSNLNNLITYLQYGTKLHIGVLFLGNNGNRRLAVSYLNTIHSSPMCMELKSRYMGYKKCYECRNRAIEKAVNTKMPFGGYCINGIYEYTHPVVIDGEVICIIFVGNIIFDDKIQIVVANAENNTELISTMEYNFGNERCRCISGIIESYIRMTIELSENKDDEFDPLLENIKKIAEENLECDISIADIAELFHYNQKYLGRVFKMKTGKSFSQYIIQRRIEKAKWHLCNSKDTILSISETVGFKNVTYFNRMFQKHSGMSPGEFRKIYSTEC